MQILSTLCITWKLDCTYNHMNNELIKGIRDNFWHPSKFTLNVAPVLAR